jgi:hypothetical protein
MKQIASRTMATFSSDNSIDFQGTTRCDSLGNRNQGLKKARNGHLQNCVGTFGSANAQKWFV